MNTRTDKSPCPRCEDRRVVTSGHLNDERPRWVSCPKCLGAGPVEPSPDCYEPITGLKHEVVAALNAIGSRPTNSEREIEQLRTRINRIANLPLDKQTTQNNLTIAALRARLAVLEREVAGDATRTN